tara:strand:- start:5415 stop:5894 length:480 start_codon:yes stop_codon:yes gene_type:complete
MDPVTAFAVIKTATGAIQQAIKIGKDFSQLGGYVSKWANAEATLDVAASKKGSVLGKVLGKLSSVEQTAIEAHMRKEELARIRAEMKEIFLLYGSAGQWERLQAEIAHARAERKILIKERERIAERNKALIVAGIGLAFISVGGYYYINYMMELKGISW